MIDESMFQYGITRQSQPESLEFEEPGQQPQQKITFFRLLTYPISGPGLSVIAIYAGVPFLWVLLLYMMPLMLRNGMFFAGLLVKGTVSLSTFWYLAVCVRASAEGQIKAPNVFEFSQDDSFGDWFREFFFIAVAVFVCIGPALILERYTEIGDTVFWLVLSAGMFFLPMMLLAVVIFDTINALNPLLIIASIFSTFFSYLLVVVLFCVPVLLFVGLSAIKGGTLNLMLLLVIRAAGIYLLMIDACLLGRFFYNNEEKLRWDV